MRSPFAILSVMILLSSASAQAPGFGATVRVEPRTELKRLLDRADTDRDKKITVEDREAKRFMLQDTQGRRFEVAGIFQLSNLLQELKLAGDRRSGAIREDRIFENPVSRVSRLIRELYWDGLTRRVDASHLSQVLADSKLSKSEWLHLYVPHRDEQAYQHFSQAAVLQPKLKLKVWRLPEKIGDKELSELNGRHGLLTLGLRRGADGALEGIPYVVPGGRFNEMYGWDSYFEALGLLQDDRVDLALAMVDNFVYQIEHYGKILNANRSYYLNRSQPPFLSSMILAVYERIKKNEGSKHWLERSLRAAMREYFQVWMGQDRLTATGLSRYFGSGHGIPPEVEKGHFDFILSPAARRHKLPQAEFEKRYNLGKIQDPLLDEFFAHDRAVRESGHDTTYRWRVGGRDRAGDFVTVDLNSLLYKYELDFARVLREEFGGKLSGSDGLPAMTAVDWDERARKRKALILRYLWDPERKMFFDYCFKDGFRSQYVSATAFYPLWAQDDSNAATRILDEKNTKDMVQALLAKLEVPGGLASTSEESLRQNGDRRHPRQWEYPNGWAPHQMLAWEALRRNGFGNEASRLIYRWLYTIARNAADYNGTVPEKFDVLKRSHAVFAEYGNVGTEFSYITQEGFGWMNASYQVGLALLEPKWRPYLDRLVPPEWVELETVAR